MKKKSKLIGFTVLMAVIAITFIACDDKDDEKKPDIAWTGIDGPIGTEFFYDVAFGSGKFVAVAGNGKMAYSSDGIEWTEITATNSTFPANLFGGQINGIAFGSGKFVAVSSQNNIAYSSDGVSWTQATKPTGWTASTTNLNDVVWGSDKFVTE